MQVVKTGGETASAGGPLKIGGPGTPEGTVANDMWRFRLYVAGQTPKTSMAIENLKMICAKYLKGKCTIEVIDLVANPQFAARDQIVAVPTLVPEHPASMRRIIGDLSDTEKVLAGLGVRSAA
jgi:circadian clock protein KaiB